MIPSDVASRLQLTADAAVGRIPSVQQVADALAELVPGQRVLAEIQALLPNGAYRAIINQREVTLALPFSAKAGDTLELEVVDNEGKLVLAAVAGQTKPGAGKEAQPQAAVETTLSRTGSFIATLLNRDDEAASPRPAPLNAQQPVAATPPQKGAELVPLLKEAIANSGMFYESHQSQWVSAQRPLESLLTEPQGRLSPRLADSEAAASSRRAPTGEAGVRSASASVSTAEAPEALLRNAPEAPLPAAGRGEALPTLSAGMAQQLVAQDLVPLVQQQLEALATQTYVWQGQAWPGQAMRWEIEEDRGRQRAAGDEGPVPWQTRLTLTMPNLGEVHAALRIAGGEVTLALTAGTPEAEARLNGGNADLRNQLESAGLTVGGLSVGRHDRIEE